MFLPIYPSSFCNLVGKMAKQTLVFGSPKERSLKDGM